MSKTVKSATSRMATDVGGTFTDLVYLTTDPETGGQAIVSAKTDTTPPAFEEGVLEVIRKSGVEARDAEFLAHGTTVVINALTERRGAKTGLITTAGFRDSLEIARGNRPDFFNLFYEKPAPFVPRHLRRELPGRMAHDGSEREALNLDGLAGIVDTFRAARVEAVAICLLHAYANPEHEERVLAALREQWPEVSAVASHEITREWREYERSSTAVLSAYVQPTAERYLSRLDEALRADGVAGPVYVMQSNCGVDSLEHVKRIPITMVESGPASGFWGAAALGRAIGEPNVLGLDIGGTTAKCSLIEDGAVRVMTDYWIERDGRRAGYPIMVPVVDLVEIGSGGGSIASVDDFGKLRVGPRSAGAVPGPAAYGAGGTEATTTDAHLALGRINPSYFRGGEAAADMEAAGRALDGIAKAMGIGLEQAALGLVRIANNDMMNALKLVSVNRGHDPRDFALVAFGGGGGLHAVDLARALGVSKVVIPRAADVFSAWGMLMSDLRRDYFHTRLVALEPTNAAAIGELIEEVERQALAEYAGDEIDPDRVRFTRFGKFRYENQEHSVETELPAGPFTEESVAATKAAFHENYERAYTYRLDAAVEFVGLHVVAYADIGKLAPEHVATTGRALAEARKPGRDVTFDTHGRRSADVYDGTLLEPGMTFTGPAVVETPGTTVIVAPGDRLTMDQYGNLHIYVRPGGGIE